MDQEASAKHLVSEMVGLKKELETSKQVLEMLKKNLNDRYDRISHDIGNDSKFVDDKAKKVFDDVDAMKRNFGDATKLDEDIKRWKKGIGDASKEVTETKAEIIKLTAQLNTLDANKNISVERKAKAVEEISKSHSRTKEKVGEVRKTIKKTAEEIDQRAEDKV